MDIPEHEKLKKVAEKSQACGEFVEHLLHEGLLQETRKKSFVLQRELARFFGINERKLEAEKRAMLESLQNHRADERHV